MDCYRKGVFVKFWEALKVMQEDGKRCYVKSEPNIFYYWGDVLNIPCLKDSQGREILVNSWYMMQEWLVDESR